jgi:uncharacterized protein YfaP (DUF2135 family)
LFLQARIVLTWGKEPKDLDSHTIVPSLAPNGAICDVSWNSKVCNGGHVQLDLDATKGMGPETQTIKEFDAGQYVYYVVEVFFSLYSYFLATISVTFLCLSVQYAGNPKKPSWNISNAKVSSKIQNVAFSCKRWQLT